LDAYTVLSQVWVRHAEPKTQRANLSIKKYNVDH